MFCPKCSQQQASEEIRFCSRCGFLLTGIAEVIKNDGLIPAKSNQETKNLTTPRKKGFKQGLFMLLILLLTSPILLIIGKELEIHPAPLFLTLFVLFISAVIRMIYALMFESGEALHSTPKDFQAAPGTLGGQQNVGSLPPAQANPAADFVPPAGGNWRDTNDFAYSTVTDATTKQLDKKSESEK
jgi:hypothetical protein